jgi:hypothetical protein
MTPSRAVPLFVLAAALLLGTGWWLGRVTPGGAPADRAAHGADVSTERAAPEESLVRAAGVEKVNRDAAEAVAVPPTVTAVAVAPAPLPPPGTRVTEVFDDLLERARRGDARAACRLASDLQRCRGNSRPGEALRRGPNAWEARVAEVQDEQQRERMIANLAEFEARRDESVRMCEGVTMAQIDAAFPLQMQAAQARPELRVQAALAPALDRLFPGSELERWQQYGQVAQPWLEQAAAQGDLAAIIALARVHGDDRRPGPPTPPYRDIDDARFVTYADLLERYGMPLPPAAAAAADAARARLAPDVLHRAQARADALYRPAAMPTEEQRRAALQLSRGSPFDQVDCD